MFCVFGASWSCQLYYAGLHNRFGHKIVVDSLFGGVGVVM
jgi:hypothetical protein